MSPRSSLLAPRASLPAPRSPLPAPRWAKITLWVLIILFSIYFTALAVNLHAAHRTHMADLGQIDLAIWNTSQGRFVQEINGDQISTRLTDHVEPIFAPVSLVFFLWNDVRALLALQAIALALGAWPVFYIAWGRLGNGRPGNKVTRKREEQGKIASSSAPLSPYRALAALAFVVAYLLYPPMQAALVAEFHALPLATPLILLAFLFSERQQWGRFALAALSVALVQEGAALLTAMLGLYALARGLQLRRTRHSASNTPHSALLAGALVALAGLTWFYISTFVIIPRYAFQAYGDSVTPYAARFGALGDGFGDVLRSLLIRPGLVLRVASEPLRVHYMLKLLAPVGFLALAGPEILLLGLPLLLANLLSSFPFQYSGQLHYSAPLAAYAIVAAIFGSQRLRQLTRRSVAGLRLRRVRRWHRAYLPLSIWLLAWSLASQIAWGYTPIGAHFRDSSPQITAHNRLLDRFLAQIPPDAAVSTMPTLYPHLSHRPSIYKFPALGNSQFVLLDIAAATGWSIHPLEMRREVDNLLKGGQWTVQDGADGYLLLRKNAAEAGTEPPVQQASVAAFPPDFYSFARPEGQPQHPLDITYTSPNGAQVKLVGYDVLPDPQWRSTAFRFYWQPVTPLPEGTSLRVSFVTPDGREVESTDQRPLIQPLWFPPDTWQVGETIVTDKLDWYLPKQWAPAVGVFEDETWADPARRWRVSSADGATGVFDDANWVLLDSWQWRDNRLEPMPPPQAAPANATFAGDGWTVQLTGVSERERAAPGQRVPLALEWQAQGPAPRDYTIFAHLRDAAGNTIAQSDSTPTWFGSQPTTGWQGGQPVWTAHSLDLPADLPPGVYDLVVGWYYWETVERLAMLGPDGQPIGDSAPIGRIEVDTTAGPRPDLVCALVPETCESQ